MSIIVICPGCKAKLRVRDEYAGKSMKCPRCSATAPIPAKEVSEVEPIEETGIEEVRPFRGPPERQRPSERRRTIKCPECGRRNPDTARQCRFCEAPLDADEDFGEREDSAYVPCPKCGAPGPSKVKWTWWGSYLGPKLFHQVRCPECEHSYNGMSGGSNIGPMIIFVTIPLLGIAGILVALFFVLKSKGVF
jgi:hypothetical protein